MSILAGIGSIVGGLFSAGAAGKAQTAQNMANAQNINLQTETRDLIRQDQSPFLFAGQDANAIAAYLLGAGPAPMIGGEPLPIETYAAGDEYEGTSNNSTRYVVNGQVFTSRGAAEQAARAGGTTGTPYGGYQATPGYQFAVDESRKAVEASAAARGQLFSGATQQGISDRAGDMANQEIGNYLSRIMNMANSGQNAGAGLASAAQNTANQIGQSYGNMGQAGAQAATARGNALSEAFTGGIDLLGYMNNTSSPAGGKHIY